MGDLNLKSKLTQFTFSSEAIDSFLTQVNKNDIDSFVLNILSLIFDSNTTNENFQFIFDSAIQQQITVIFKLCRLELTLLRSEISKSKDLNRVDELKKREVLLLQRIRIIIKDFRNKPSLY